MANTLVRYPIGIQSFEKLRKLSYLYVDKTVLIYDLVNSSNSVFLSRPRRFGKSLLLSTIQAYFEGKKELFKGLAMEQLETEWPVHPVLTLSLAKYDRVRENSLEEILVNQFDILENEYNVNIKATNLAARFENIIRGAYKATGQTVVADSLLSDIDAGDADWLIVPGGVPGAPNLHASEAVSDMLRAHSAKGGRIASICAGPAIVLAPLGILKGKKATCYPGLGDKIKAGGGTYIKEPVVIDGNIITSEGPGTTLKFAGAIISATLGRQKADETLSSMLAD